MIELYDGRPVLILLSSMLFYVLEIFYWGGKKRMMNWHSY